MSTTDEPRDGVAVALLRGINVGRHRRIKMADLREALTAAGFERVRTLLQSGNVVLDAPGVPPEEVERRVHDAVLAFSGFDVAWNNSAKGTSALTASGSTTVTWPGSKRFPPRWNSLRMFSCATAFRPAIFAISWSMSNRTGSVPRHLPKSRSALLPFRTA